MDNELFRIWQLVHELSDQLAHNQEITKTLQAQAAALKVCSASNHPRNTIQLHFVGTSGTQRLWFCFETIQYRFV